MTWRKFFKPVNSVLPVSQRAVDSTSAYASTAKYSNWLPEVYSGPPDRLQRYAVYDQMGYDHEISAAVDTIADFGTECDEVSKLPLVIKFNDDPTPSEIQILEKTLGQWVRLNKLSRRLWRMFRSTLMYGDQFFIRDPETYKLYWIDPAKVEKVIVNESEGKKIESYFVKDIDLNMKNLVATNQLNKLSNQTFGSNSIIFSPPMQGNMNYVSGGYGGAGTANYQDGGATAVDAEHIVQLSLTDGMNAAWPFGLSILEQIYKVYKQKELLEDAILIYRVHRAPERRVFFIDVGTMPPNKAQQYLERIRYEVQQKRIPSRTGGGCFAMDTQVPLLDGRTLTISELTQEYINGKENWAYSCDPITGKMIPGLISWAGVTQKSAKVMKITLDNGEEILCTPEHKFPIKGKGFVEARNIIPNEDSFFSFNTRLHNIDNKKFSKSSKYQQVYDHSINDWVYTHRAVANFMKELNFHNDMLFNVDLIDKDKSVIHHFDFNKYNNSPDNLKFMNGYDHFLYHAQYTDPDRYTDEEKSNIKEKSRLTSSLKSNDQKMNRSLWQTICVLAEWHKIKQNEGKYNKIKERLNKNLLMSTSKFKNQSLIFNDDLFAILCKYVNNISTDMDDVVKYLSNNIEFMREYRHSNIPEFNKINHLDYTKFSKQTLRTALRSRGFHTWNEFLKSINKSIQKPSRKIKWTDRQLKIFVDLVKNNNITYKLDAYFKLTENSEFLDIFCENNRHIKGNAKIGKFTQNTFNVFLYDHGYKGWSDFRNKIALYNHKIISAEYLENEIEVGTLTIDGDNKYHNHHTFAIKQGVYTKNSNVVDSTYNPMSILEDYFFAVTSEGRGSKVEVLPGGENLGDIDDLRYFNNKMLRALGVPSSYLPTGPEDGTAAVNDGRVGTAFIQEFRFAKVVARYQQQIIEPLDLEFKLFLKHRGVTIDNSLFELEFTPPQSFSEYRQLELDAARINTFTALTDISFVSKRFILKTYLGWSEEQLAENERMWKEERSRLTKTYAQDQGTAGRSAPAGLSDVGITSSGIDDMAPEENPTDDTGINDMPGDVTDTEVDNFGEQ